MSIDDSEQERYLEEGDAPITDEDCVRNNLRMEHPAFNLTPIGMRVLVRRDAPKQKAGNAGLIWIPEDDQVEGQFATVLALGTGNDFEGKPVQGRFNVKINDRVCLFQHGGTRIQRGDLPSFKDAGNGDGLTLIVEHADILGIVEES